MRIILFTLILLFASCNKTKLINFDKVFIKVPKNWNKVDLKSIDSNNGYIKIDEKDTLFYEVGYYTSSLTEERSKRIVDISMKEIIDSTVDTSQIIFVSNYKNDLDYYYKQNAVFEKKGVYLIKYVFPRFAGNGITGIYIDSLSNTSLGNMKLTIRGNNLSKESQEIVMALFHQLEIRD